MKLHLGCGQRHLEGYINIDFPASEHSVQDKSVADIQADITQLSYSASSIDEVRLHHVFEHFTRPVACGLLAAWQSWLRPGGILHIEVPDFQRTARVILSAFSLIPKRAVAERHLFGSHEADWAAHCEGYTPSMLKKMVATFGFRVKEIKKNSWMGTFNFELLATKNNKDISRVAFDNIVSGYLKNYLLDDSASEDRLLEVWMKKYKKQLEVSWAQNE
jgi:hypothetical protein